MTVTPARHAGMNCHWQKRLSAAGFEPALGGQLDSGGRLQQLDLSPQPHEGVPRFFLCRQSDVVEAADVDAPQFTLKPQHDRAPVEFDSDV